MPYRVSSRIIEAQTFDGTDDGLHKIRTWQQDSKLVAGTPNRRTQDLMERLYALGIDPVNGRATIANDATAPLELRARIQMELMSYIFPKRKALDVSSTENQSLSINIGIPQPPKPVVVELPWGTLRQSPSVWKKT